jgi:hypothetical protein
MQLPFPLNAQQATHAVNSLGINVTEEQVGMAMAAMAFAYRWIGVELKVIKASGGVRVMWSNFWTGFWGVTPAKPKPTNAELAKQPYTPPLKPMENIGNP